MEGPQTTRSDVLVWYSIAGQNCLFNEINVLSPDTFDWDRNACKLEGSQCHIDVWDSILKSLFWLFVQNFLNVYRALLLAYIGSIRVSIRIKVVRVKRNESSFFCFMFTVLYTVLMFILKYFGTKSPIRKYNLICITIWN